jgi:hypothetical protein
MDKIRLLLTAIAAPGEDASGKGSAESQLVDALKANNISAYPRYFTRDAVGEGATYLGQAIEVVEKALPVVGTVVGIWLRGRFGRKIKLKVDDDGVEVEAQTAEDVEKLLEAAKGFQQRKDRDKSRK